MPRTSDTRSGHVATASRTCRAMRGALRAGSPRSSTRSPSSRPSSRSSRRQALHAGADFEDETPIILVESPLPFEHVTSPLRVTGTANTFEATFNYDLVDSAGKVIATHFVTATSGSGTRGTFDFTVPYTVSKPGLGKLVVYELVCQGRLAHPLQRSPDIPRPMTRARFRELHAREQLFVMPNPWDIGSAKLLESCGFEALATTSAGFAWSLGKLDQQVTRDELVAHVASLAAATSLPLNVDSERLYPDEPGGVAETVRLLAEAGAAGCSIEDYDPASDSIDDRRRRRSERVAEAARGRPSPAPTPWCSRPLREPPPRDRRPGRHHRPADRLSRCRRRLCLRAGPDRPRPDRQRRRGSRRPGQRARAAERADHLRARLGRRAARLDRQPAGRGGLRSADDGARELQADGTSDYAANRVPSETLRAAFEP